MRQLGLPVAANWQDVGRQLDTEQLSYLPLRHFCYALHEMMQLRPLLGLRSPVNTLARMINPLRAAASLQSIFHPAYAVLHQQTDSILGQPRALVFKGDSGEVEIKPQADTRLHLLVDGVSAEMSLPRSVPERVASTDFPSVEPLQALWHNTSSDEYGLDATLATTATALLVLQPGLALESAQQQAGELWQQRDLSRLS
jgi:anthranilate phosphoribosyltransferase